MTPCPDEIREAVAELLRIGLLRIRDAGGSGDSERCFIEADHVHNLPQLLKQYSPELLTFYLTTEREAFLEQLERHPGRGGTVDDDVRQHRALWIILERHANAHVASA